jgi:AbrB family looped-hinge helix DNA binding protein
MDGKSMRFCRKIALAFYSKTAYNRSKESNASKEYALLKEAIIMMDMARVSIKGQVTIPIEIRRKLGLREGDKVVFMEQGENIILLNSNRIAWKELQTAFQGAAEEAGFQSEEDVVDFCKEVRQEMWEERNGRDD